MNDQEYQVIVLKNDHRQDKLVIHQLPIGNAVVKSITAVLDQYNLYNLYKCKDDRR